MYCFVCKSNFYSANLLTEHLKKVHFLGSHSTYRCIENSCSQVFQSLSSFKRHVMRKHFDNPNPKETVEALEVQNPFPNIPNVSDRNETENNQQSVPIEKSIET